MQVVVDTEAEELINELNEASNVEQSAPVFETKEPEFPPDPQQAPKTEEPPMSASKAHDIAMLWVKRFSSFMKLVFTPIYKKTILVKGDIEKMREFAHSNKGKSEREMQEIIHSDHELAPVQNRFDKYIRAIDEIPLNQDEMEELAQPLSELVIKYKAMQLSPEWMLVIAVGLAILPRIAHVMPDLSNLISKSE